MINETKKLLIFSHIGLILTLTSINSMAVYASSNNNEDEDDEDEDIITPSYPSNSNSEPDISDKALSLFTSNKINNTEYRMILCGILMSRSDASAGALIDCHSLFDNDNTIGNENQTFYSDINNTITGLLSRYEEPENE